MDLSSMLNGPPPTPSKAPKPIEPSPAPTPSQQPPIPSTAINNDSGPQDGQRDEDGNNEDLMQPRKRPRLEDPPSPSSVALASAKPSVLPPQPAKSTPSSTSSTKSPEQERKSLPPQPRFSISVPSDALEPTIMNIQPHEELTRHISDFIFLNLGAAENLEIEAKLGRIINLNTGERIRLPVITETVVVNDTSEFAFHTRFESNMTEKQHKNFNQYLNKAFQNSRAPQANGSGSPKPPRVPLHYLHTRQIDMIYQIPNEPNSRNAQKIRVSTDPKGNVLATIIKENLAHLNIHSPKTPFDWRISINNERTVEGGLPSGYEQRSERRKDRMTYLHQHIQIDLTQVHNPAETTKSHELEVELRDIEALRAEAENAKQGKPSKYEDMVRVFVDNVRLLARSQS